MAKYKLEKNLQPTKDGKWLYHAQFVPEWTVREEELLDNVTVGGVATYMERADQANVNLFI